jgi:hypothetical protein
MANNLDRLLQGVSENTNIRPGIVQLLHNIATQAGDGADNPAAAMALAALLRERAEHIAGHVMANTPMILATPPVHLLPVDPDHETKDAEEALAKAKADHERVLGAAQQTAAHVDAAQAEVDRKRAKRHEDDKARAVAEAKMTPHEKAAYDAEHAHDHGHGHGEAGAEPAAAEPDHRSKRQIAADERAARGE